VCAMRIRVLGLEFQLLVPHRVLPVVHFGLCTGYDDRVTSLQQGGNLVCDA
jgi:hypothetical protein